MPKNWLIIQQLHDYRPTVIVVDPEDLNTENPVDNEILNAALTDRGYIAQVGPGLEEPSISGRAIRPTDLPLQIDRIVWLTIICE